MKYLSKMTLIRAGLLIGYLLAGISGGFAGSDVADLTTPVGNLYILTVGIDNYQEQRFNLRFAKADAIALADEFEKRGKDNENFKTIKKTILLDSQAKKDDIISALDSLAREIESHDTFIFSFAGIGDTYNQKSAEFYLLPADAVQESITETGISNTQLHALFRKIRAKNKLVILDACKSASGYESAISAFVEQDQKVAELNKENILFIGTDTQALELSKFGHGVITQTILDGIKGEADLNTDGIITALELEAQIYKKVFVYLAEFSSNLHPRTIFRGENFQISLTDKKLEQIAQDRNLNGDANNTDTRTDVLPDGETEETAAERKGTDYAILFANDVFDNPDWRTLKNPQNDVNDVKKELEERYNFKEVIVKTNLTTQEIYDTIKKYEDPEFKNFNAVEDQLFIFFAGHGIADKYNKGFYVGRDSLFPKNSSDLSAQEEGSLVSLDSILNKIDRIPLQHIMVVFDACFAGQIWKPSIQLVQESAFLEDKRNDSEFAHSVMPPLLQRNLGASSNFLNFAENNSFNVQKISKLAYAKRKMKERSRRVLTSGDKPVFDSWKKKDGTRSNNSPFADAFLRALRTDGGDWEVLITAHIVPFIDKLPIEPQVGKISGSDGDFVFVKPDKTSVKEK